MNSKKCTKALEGDGMKYQDELGHEIVPMDGLDPSTWRVGDDIAHGFTWPNDQTRWSDAPNGRGDFAGLHVGAYWKVLELGESAAVLELVA